MNEVTIGEGSLQGKGVYANRDFKKDEVVIQYNLKSLTQEEYEALPDDEKDFIHTHWGTIFLYGEPERYVNHSNNPNTHPNLVNAVKCDVAVRNIEKGEMITTNAKLDDIS